MNARMRKHLKYAAAYFLTVSSFIVTAVPAAQAEALFLFRSPDTAESSSNEIPRAVQQKTFLKLDEKGDLLIQCGSARVTIAYNAPADQFRPSGRHYNPQQEYSVPGVGIRLAASLSF